MAYSNQDRRKKIFDLFSQNLDWVKEHPEISFHPDFSNGYICPLCFDLFFKKDLDLSLENHLTLEDVPPKSLGGKPLALTCKNCNSRSGNNLDKHLLNRLLEEDSKEFLPNSKADATFELNKNKINGNVEVDTKGAIRINLERHRSNPIDSDNFKNDLVFPKSYYNPIFYPDKLLNHESISPTFSINFKKTSIERRAEIALLRIAYLIAFSTFGNGFYINSNLYKIREQILNPDKNILPSVFWIKYKFSKENEGINIITLPKESRSFLIIFNLKTKSAERQFAIVLPGPSDPGLKVYDFLEKGLNENYTKHSLEGVIEHIKNNDFLKNKDYVFASDMIWHQYTSEDYKPNFNNKN